MASAAVQRRVGRYEIVREVGRGGTAVVYLARQSDLDRDVALKELAGLHASDPAFVERFLRESRVAGSLNHPNIVTVHEYFEHEGTAFIAMEYFERGSLRGVVSGLALPQVAGVLEGILAGLGHAHARGIVHRDLKPENVMVTSSGAVKIADFGVAKVLEDAAGRPLTLSGTTLGTPAYMAPEQALATEVGPPADLYAVGVMAYEMLSGDVPFHGSEVAMAIMLQHLNEAPPPLREGRPDLDPALCVWVERLLAKAPADRPDSASSAWDELEEAVIGAAGPRWHRSSRLTGSDIAARAHRSEGSPSALTETQPAPTRELPTRRRRALVLAVSVGAAFALLAGGVALAVDLTGRGGEATDPPRQSTESRATSTTPAEPRPLLTSVALVPTDPVRVRLRFSGDPLKPGVVHVRDGDISDGHAWLVLAQRGIAAGTQGLSSGDVRVRVRKAKNRLRVDFATGGKLERARAKRIDGRTVLVTFTTPPPTTGTTGSTNGPNGGSQPSATTTTDTTPSKPSKPSHPVFPSG
jgi:Protein kinase domain